MNDLVLLSCTYKEEQIDPSINFDLPVNMYISAQTRHNTCFF